ncbi:hypothetical protein A2U01_0053259, partial [Trifolium medium]|nr:hypothetical protein [Trifolium medium]
STNLNPAQFSFFSSAKLLSDLLGFELPTVKDFKEEEDRQTRLCDSIQSKLDCYFQNSDEVRSGLSTYRKDQEYRFHRAAAYPC